ncbi:MAG: hypothetical protein ACI9WC_001658 [Arenicella sp.]
MRESLWRIKIEIDYLIKFTTISEHFVKKNLFLSLLVSAAALVSPLTASAACGATACEGVIETIYYTQNGTIYLGTDGDETSLNCTSVANVYVTVPASNPNQNAIYATALSAKIAGEKTVIRIVEGSSNCELQWIRLDPAS